MEGQLVVDGGLTWGGEHTMQCTDDKSHNCAPETCIILLTGVNKFNKKDTSKKKLVCVKPIAWCLSSIV